MGVWLPHATGTSGTTGNSGVEGTGGAGDGAVEFGGAAGASHGSAHPKRESSASAHAAARRMFVFMMPFFLRGS